MRISQLILRAGVFALAGLIGFGIARAAVSVLEDRSAVAVKEALIDSGEEWTSVVADGLQVILEGEAQNEARRFRAITTAGSVVDASRVIDNMSIAELEGVRAPTFALEILRNDGGVSLSGLVPAESEDDNLGDWIARAVNGQTVTDLLNTSDYAAPEDWQASVALAVRALEMLPRTKISVRAGRVSVDAISDSIEQKRIWENRLRQMSSPEVRVTINITAPRPVASPFLTRFVLDDTGAQFDNCTADTASSRNKILMAARNAGLVGETVCTLALGVPSTTWGDTVSAAIDAVKKLGGGTVTISDADITLVALEGTDQNLFDEIVGALENDLPDLYDLDATLPKPPAAGDEGPPRFSATLSPEGQVQIRGKVGTSLLNTTAQNYAKARFGADAVHMGTLIAEDLPADWSVRVLAALEGLSHMENGAIIVEPEKISVNGKTGNLTAQSDITQLFVEKLGDDANFDLNIDYVKALDPLAGLPTPEECIAQILDITQTQKILFDPGSDSLTSATQPVIDKIAEVLTKCDSAPIEIAGYTDSQGREEMNLTLSKNRAEAVLTALRARRVPTGTYEANGYGEEDPIADNETEEGREANRRIEFRLIGAETADASAAGDDSQNSETQ